MATARMATGSGVRQGELWGQRPGDWGALEEQQLPTYEEGIKRVGVKAGDRVLDVGCGTGVFLCAITDLGARAYGLDASRALLRVARARVPEADLRVGEAEFLPHEDDSFDLVTGFNSFFFADDMTAALREAGRVAKPEAPVLVQVWGRPERCDLTPMLAAAGRLKPPAPEPRSAPPPLWKQGVLESIAEDAGLAAEASFDLRTAYEFPDERTLIDRMLSPGGVTEAIRHSGEQAVADAIVGALAPHRQPGGGYRLENEWHYMLARAE
jgi:ubiquinone/menaquinone biosynthesis C-methylase UbiE